MKGKTLNCLSLISPPVAPVNSPAKESKPLSVNPLCSKVSIYSREEKLATDKSSGVIDVAQRLATLKTAKLIKEMKLNLYIIDHQ